MLAVEHKQLILSSNVQDMRWFLRLLPALLMPVFGLHAQSLKSPADYLGYPIGSQFTPHHKLIGYFQYAESVMPANMRLISYGKTNEGRDLLVAIVGNPENIRRWQDIQQNNMRLCGFLTDKPGDPNMPAVVWLSFNVHGNEPSSSEAAIALLHALVEPSDARIKSWLKNTLIVIDPCLNPDGRDRYVQWYNQTKGLQPDPLPFSREHREPWPGGRGNHYLYDLNRDWAWQIQQESRQRMALYHQWMPVIHADYHEQMENSPYYFAPAAEPYHEVITPWQRRFQQQMGKNHASYFDKNGWLYFTREYFDLFYPSYGDTYPIFNGSIGVTYEQAGHARAGLSILVESDTLSLTERVQHHCTTAISTIEVASQNTTALNKAFQTYFEEARSGGSGQYAGYLIRKQTSLHWKKLTDLLARNQIQYQLLEAGSPVSGFHYLSQGTKRVTTEHGDIFVSTKQAQGNLVRVLFEPSSALSDSATYDITSWSLPFAFGLDAYALEKSTGIKTANSSATSASFEQGTQQETAYGYIVHIRNGQDATFLAKALQAGMHIRYAEKELLISGTTFARGSPIILSAENKNQLAECHALFKQHNADWMVLPSGLVEGGVDMGSDKIHRLHKQTVALVMGEACSPTAVGDIWHYFDKELQYPIHLVSSNEITVSNLKSLDVLIFPDGQHKILADKESILKTWVKEGGRIIALEQSIESMITGEWGIKWKKAAETMSQGNAYPERYEERERKSITSNTPGAIYKSTVDESHPLAFGYTSQHYFVLKQNGQLLETNASIWNVAWMDANAHVSGFVGSEVKNQLKDGTLIGVQEMGKGSVVYFVDSPVFRGFWENGKRWLFNAVFYQ